MSGTTPHPQIRRCGSAPRTGAGDQRLLDPVTRVIEAGTGKAANGAELDRRLIEALKSETVRDAAELVSVSLGLAKRRVYTRALELKQGRK